MGQYVYRVTKEKVKIEGYTAQVAVFAYKPTYSFQQVGDKCISADQLNHKMAFKTGCMAKTKIDTDYIITFSEDRESYAIYGNPNKLRTFLDDSTMGTPKMPLIKSVDAYAKS